MASIVTVCVVAGFLYTKWLPRMYEATATVQVESGDGQRLTKSEARETAPPSEPVLKTIEQNLVGPSVLKRIVQDPELAKDRAFLPDVPRPTSVDRLVTALASRVEASARRGTQLIDVSVQDESPAMAQKLTGVLIEQFLRDNSERRLDSSGVSHSYLVEEAGRLNARLSDSELALQRYKEENRAFSLTEQQAVVSARLQDLSAKVTAANESVLKLAIDRAQVERLAQEPPERLLTVPSIASAVEVGELLRKINEKETEIAALSRRYKAEHPKFIQAASEVAELKSARDQAALKAASLMSTELEAAQSSVVKLGEALRSQEEAALELSKMALPYQALEREVVANRTLYDALLARVKEAEVGQAITPYPVRVIAPASLPTHPSKPNKRLIWLLSGAAGVALALSYALGASLLDASLKTVDQAEQILKARSLSAIPKRDRTNLAEALRLLTTHPQSAVAETFRVLRTALHFAAREGTYRSLIFTSAVPDEGKSFCAINYAAAMAQQGYRTLLIDADLRLPSIGPAFFGHNEGAGLGDWLRSRRPLEELSRATEVDNLFVVTAGTPLPNPAEAVGRAPFFAFVEEALKSFERVVIDTAPVHAVSETLLLASQADAVCLVVRAGKTPAAVALRAMEKLRESGARVPGFVLNGVRPRNGGYYYHYQASGYGRDEIYGGSAAVANR